MNCATLCFRLGAFLYLYAAKLAELTPLKNQKKLMSKNYCFIAMNLILIFCSDSRVNAGIVEVYTNQGVALAGTYAENNSYIFGNTFNTNANLSKISSVSMYLLKSSAPINGNMFVSISTVKSSGSNYVPDQTLAISDYIAINSLTTTIASTTFSFSGSNAVNLAANTKYAFAFNISSTDRIVNGNTVSATVGAGVAGQNYFETLGSGYDTYSEYGMLGTVKVNELTAVPEPGPLVLFSLALAVGGVVAYLMRRKPNMPEDISATLQLPS
jgi:hypothetical protein